MNPLALLTMMALLACAVATVLAVAMQRQSRRMAEMATMEAESRRREARSRRLVDVLPEGVIALDRAATLHAINPAAARLLGLSADSLLGRRLDELDLVAFDEGGNPLRARPILAEILRHPGRKRDVVLGVLDPRSGVTSWLLASAAVADDSDGGEGGGKDGGESGALVVVALTDITARRAAAEAERVAGQRFRTIYENAPVGIILSSASGHVLQVNPAACQLFGVRADEFSQLGVWTVTAPEFRALTEEYWASLMSGRLPAHSVEKRYVRPDGSSFDGEAVIATVTNEAGRVEAAVTFLWDITLRKRAQRSEREATSELERRVAERTRQLEQANRELEAFSYSVSHDLRAPLRAISGYAQILGDAEQEADPERRRMFGRIAGNAQRMGELIDDILDYSRAGRLPLKRDSLDTAVLVAGLVEELRGAHPEARITLGPLPRVVADPTMLRQVWQNLIDNALKFSAHREPPQIAIDCSAGESGEVVFAVRDNGAGFDMAYAGKLFGMFQRLHADQRFPGTGVGLAIVMRLVERHGGRIWAEAEVERGAVFRFTLGGDQPPM